MTGETDLNTNSQNYEELNVIGNGAYGVVYKARSVTDGQIVALKKLRVPLTEEGLPMSTVREIALLRQLGEAYQHPNIIRLLDICHGKVLEKENQLVLFLVFEHLDKDLASYMEHCPPPGLSTSLIRDIMFQILSGVDFLHSHRIVHRDIKPENILVSNSGTIKLADFGLAKTYDFEMRLTSVVVTLWYRAPEVLLGQTYATPVDLWSCGCIFAELFKRSPLCNGSSEADQLDKIFRIIGTPSEQEWPENVSLSWNSFHPCSGVCFESFLPELGTDGENLLKSMLSFDPLKRINAFNALLHPYFKESGYNYSSPVRSPSSEAGTVISILSNSSARTDCSSDDITTANLIEDNRANILS